MAAAIAIRELEDSERVWANELYRSIRFEATPAEALALVAELAGERVGLGRLVPLAPDVLELGGIWTDEAVRGRGVARAMVNALLSRVAETDGPDRLWCIPFAHLSTFYQSFGFAVSAPPWPPQIAKKVAHCVEEALPEVVVLARLVR